MERRSGGVKGKIVFTLFNVTAFVVWPTGAEPERGPARLVWLVLAAMSRFSVLQMGSLDQNMCSWLCYSTVS